MPELPEVETMCRSIAAVAGCCIKGIEQPRTCLQSIDISPPLGIFRRRIIGHRVAGVRRLGKRVVFELEAGRTVDVDQKWYLVIEPRMTGLVLPADPPDRKHLRLVFRFNGRRPAEVLFWDQRGLGVVRLLSHQEFLDCFGGDQIGPDALDITPRQLQARLGISRRAIKVALLDQHAVAGVGNIYASEILHLAKIHPATSCRQLKLNNWMKLCVAMRKILLAAIRHNGSTLGDDTYRVSRRRRGRYQDYHRVYQRAGQRCLTCGQAQIVRIVQAQRSTFFCPICQPACDSTGGR